MRNKTTLDKNGKRMYFIDSKVTSKKKYEETMGKFIEPVEPKGVEVIMRCPFDDKDGTRSKFVNLQEIRLCEDHYQRKTTGEIAAAIR